MTRFETTTDSRSRLRQALAEHDLVEHVKDALRLALSWNLREVGLARKLTSVRFCTESLVRHLQLMMDMEEQGGYLDDIGDQKPHLSDRSERLAAEHARIRSESTRVLALVEAATPENDEGFQECCRELELLLARLDDHESRERELFFELYCDDEGGEG